MSAHSSKPVRSFGLNPVPEAATSLTTPPAFRRSRSRLLKHQPLPQPLLSCRQAARSPSTPGSLFTKCSTRSTQQPEPEPKRSSTESGSPDRRQTRLLPLFSEQLNVPSPSTSFCRSVTEQPTEPDQSGELSPSRRHTPQGTGTSRPIAPNVKASGGSDSTESNTPTSPTSTTNRDPSPTLENLLSTQQQLDRPNFLPADSGVGSHYAAPHRGRSSAGLHLLRQ